MSQESQLQLSWLPKVDTVDQLKPKGQRVIIKPIEKLAIKTEGGVYLPEPSKEQVRKSALSKGTVIAVGPGATETKVGETVLFYWYEGGEGMVMCGKDILLLFSEYALKVGIEGEVLSDIPTVTAIA